MVIPPVATLVEPPTFTPIVISSKIVCSLPVVVEGWEPVVLDEDPAVVGFLVVEEPKVEAEELDEPV